MHVVSTEHLTWYSVHQKRGQEAINSFDILPHYRGILIHDCWAPYFDLTCQHALCNGHIVRELTFVYEELHQKWADTLSNLLLDMNSAARNHKTNGTDFTQEKLLTLVCCYEEILDEGITVNPEILIQSHKKQRRKKRTKPQNLLNRLQKYKVMILAFLNNLLIPFTNNQGEQDIRMIKVKMKISGCFRTLNGAKRFLSIRSYTSTVRKNNLQILPVLLAAITGNPFIPTLYSG
jgi:transposase